MWLSMAPPLCFHASYLTPPEWYCTWSHCCNNQASKCPLVYNFLEILIESLLILNAKSKSNITSPFSTSDAFGYRLWRALSSWRVFSASWLEFLDLIQQNLHYLGDWWFPSLENYALKLCQWLLKRFRLLRTEWNKRSSSRCDTCSPTCSPVSVRGQPVSSWSHRAI